MFFFFLMIPRPPRSTQSRSSAASDVYKRQHLLSGVKPPAYEPTIQLYPNPFKNEIVIVNQHNCSDLFFKLIDINGKTVITSSIKGNKVSVPVNISTGIYNAVLIDGSGKILITQKMVKE